MTLDQTAKEIFQLAPQTPFGVEDFDALPEDNEVKQFVYRIARYVERRVLDGKIEEAEYYIARKWDKNDIEIRRINQLTLERERIGKGEE